MHPAFGRTRREDAVCAPLVMTKPALTAAGFIYNELELKILL